MTEHVNGWGSELYFYVYLYSYLYVFFFYICHSRFCSTLLSLLCCMISYSSLPNLEKLMRDLWNVIRPYARQTKLLSWLSSWFFNIIIYIMNINMRIIYILTFISSNYAYSLVPYPRLSNVTFWVNCQWLRL